MKVTIYTATTLDGYIAKSNFDSDWVNDTDAFLAEINKAGCIVTGHTTFKQFEGSTYPIPNILNIVLTKNIPSGPNKYENVVYTSGSVADIIQLAGNKGYENILVVGGSKTNSYFIESGLVDDIIMDVHPLIFGEGIKLSEKPTINSQFKLSSSRLLNDNIIQLRYSKTI
jgi:dihydrofolate reductase